MTSGGSVEDIIGRAGGGAEELSAAALEGDGYSVGSMTILAVRWAVSSF